MRLLPLSHFGARWPQLVLVGVVAAAGFDDPELSGQRLRFDGANVSSRPDIARLHGRSDAERADTEGPVYGAAAIASPMASMPPMAVTSYPAPDTARFCGRSDAQRGRH
ncbi:hypothetical protein [Nocardia pseudovaccinii]|uniref:hypothetical protein n=1 Tax=Nocardia pseudovaccinii TaxID=189540 RepID=UPI0007A39AA3|nr:hypothetical protein [Nocardia pseudovaccinii]